MGKGWGVESRACCAPLPPPAPALQADVERDFATEKFGLKTFPTLVLLPKGAKAGEQGVRARGQQGGCWEGRVAWCGRLVRWATEVHWRCALLCAHLGLC